LDSGTKLAKAIARTKIKVWDPRRVTQALKKFLGLETMHRVHGCSSAWVLDSESVPLRKFSFAEQFLDYEQNPRILVSNLSDPSMKMNARHARLQNNALAGLKLPSKVTNGSVLSFRTVDFWMLSLRRVSQMMEYFSRIHNKPFANAFMRNPAGVPVYYGNYMWHFFPNETSFVVYPTSIKEAGIKPSGKVQAEASKDIFVCKGQAPWTDEQRMQILGTNGTLAWVRGFRFEHLPTNGCEGNVSGAQSLLLKSDVTWATSNFDNQVRPV